MLNKNYFFERRLLKRCAEGNAVALTEFVTLGYAAQIDRTLRETNAYFNSPLTEDEMEGLAILVITGAYTGYRNLPSWQRNLYRQLHSYAYHAVICAIQEVCDA